MKRIGNISQRIETVENFRNAFDGYSYGKHRRRAIRNYEQDIDKHLDLLLHKYKTSTWISSDYEVREIIENNKLRKLGKYPADDNVIQWAALMQIERLLCDTFIRRSCACVRHRGQHDFCDIMRKTLQSVDRTTYFVQLDVHHYFENVPLFRLVDKLSHKIKDKKLIDFISEVLYSFGCGLVLGTKLSQILGNFYLADFDHRAIRLFDIGNDPDALAYWRSRYVTDCFMTCRSKEQADELAKGVDYLCHKFDRFVGEGIADRYERFADNIIIHHSDKTFLHLVTEICIMHLNRDELLQVNKSYNVRPVYAGGIDVCGYVSFHTHRRLRKRNKVSLCRQVAKWRKKGLDPENIRLKESSRIGFAIHANANNLLRKLNINMDIRLGKIVRDRRHKIPFEGMTFDQKMSIEDIVCHIGESEESKFIQLIDFVVEDSVFDKDKAGDCTRKRLDIRFRLIERIEVDAKGEPVYFFKDDEHYAFTGSNIMISQCEEDIKRSDLPSHTVIKEFINKFKKSFYKFT